MLSFLRNKKIKFGTQQVIKANNLFTSTIKLYCVYNKKNINMQ